MYWLSWRLTKSVQEISLNPNWSEHYSPKLLFANFHHPLIKMLRGHPNSTKFNSTKTSWMLIVCDFSLCQVPWLKAGRGRRKRRREEKGWRKVQQRYNFCPQDPVILWRRQHFTYELPEEYLTLYNKLSQKGWYWQWLLMVVLYEV